MGLIIGHFRSCAPAGSGSRRACIPRPRTNHAGVSLAFQVRIADAAPVGHGVLLWFEVDDFDAAVKRVRSLKATVVEEPHVNPAPQHREMWLRDPDGYVVVIASPDGKGIVTRPVHVRLAVSADLDAVARQFHALWPDGSLAKHEEEARAILAGSPPSSMPLVVFVAEVNRQVVGFIEVGLRSHADGCDGRQPGLRRGLVRRAGA
ncbi:MAG: hypothetical protein E6J64_05255, partial [Deltaproteobacteria bacterium]